MSCQINLTGQINDVGAIRRCLFPTDDSRGSESWLHLCEVSVSPTGDIIVLANGRRLVILSVKWDSGSLLNQFHITYSGSIHESDNIKAVACLPIVNQSKSSHVVPDWTCVLLGFESGFTRFYTESCELLVEEQLHNEVITSIKCRSQHSARPDLLPDLHPEEIYIQYQSTVCVLAGNQLFPLLRTFRGELARVQAKGDTLELAQGILTPRKWGFQDQATINDIAVVGVSLHGTFDHLLTASTCGGFDTKYRSAAPYNNLVLAAGSRPFLGYHYALEGCPQPVFSDVAKAVATKLKSALPGWLTGNKTAMEKQMTIAMQPSDTMGCRFGLCDLRRTATSIILSPDHKLAAVSDALGRILLVDAFRGVTLKIFKGYREAQCSFIQVPDERHSKHRPGNKVALFLVIYSPKKGTLEIFTVQQGTKVTTFTASKFSRLIYNNYNLMGFLTTSKSKFVCQFDSILIDNDGQIKEITIPFHFALSEKNNKRARDIHLFKKLRQLLKHGECDSDAIKNEVGAVCGELKTREVKMQTVELLLRERIVPAEAILSCVQHFLLEDLEENLRILCQNVEILTNFYISTKSNLDPPSRNIQSSLNLNEKQSKNLQKLLDLSTWKREEAKIAFQETDLSASEFLSIFNLTQSDVSIKSDDDTLSKVSRFIFEKYISKCVDLEDLEERIVKSRIRAKDLFVLLIDFWMKRTSLESEMSNLFSVVEILLKTVNHEEIKSDYNTATKFWEEIREILANSKPLPALTAAIVCKLVSAKLEIVDSSTLEDIEVLSQESIEWSMLIGRLEDVSLLNIILANKPTAKFPVLPKLKHEKIDISLKWILEKGRGSVSELVARWLTASGVAPESIVLNDSLLRKKEETEEDDDKDLPKQEIPVEKMEEIKSEPVLMLLNLIQPQFPYSLQANVILTNMCWEYALAWQKDIQDLSKLEACIKCLIHIPSSHMREGLFNLVWNTHLKIIFESTSKLVNKVGKLPKERLCRQDTGLSDYQLTIFLGITTNFLDIYMDAVQQSFGLPKPALHFEQIWESGPQPLVELALQQNSINYDLLHLHYQLSLCLQMITTFSVKHSKPVHNLFESYMHGLFFVDFQTKAQINWDYADSRVQNSRVQFLFKVIAASLETVTTTENKIFASEHLRWMSKFVDLGRLWNLDLDLLRRYELVQVYTNGFDSFGDELFSAIEEKKKLGPELLVIAGKRLSNYFNTSPNLAQNTAAFTTAVTRYIEQLNGEWCAPSSLEGIENLANRSLSSIDENQYEHKVAEMLLDGVQTLRSIYKDS